MNFLPELSSQDAAFCGIRRSRRASIQYRKGTHSSPFSMVYARNAWDHNPTFGGQEQLTFYDLGFPTEA